VLGKRFDLHLAEECPHRQQVCPEGCGEKILGSLMEGHRKACPMGTFLHRAEAAIRESSVREYRLAYDGMYAERDRAKARTRARGEREPWGPKGWPSRRCEIRVGNIESESRALVQRARRRAVEHLTAAIAAAGADPSLGEEEKKTEKAPVNALKYWDAFNSEGATRGGRPWDLDAPALPQLLDALEEAAVATADIELRRRGETMLLTVLRRTIETAMGMVEDKTKILEDAMDRVKRSMKFFELLDPSELLPMMEDADVESRKAGLLDLESSPAEFFQALTDGDVDLCAWMLDRQQANPSLPEPRSRLPPLLIAAKAADVPMCRVLLEYHASVDDRCSIDGCSALHWAAHHRHFRVMEVLLEAKANPRLQDKRGQDALMKLVRRDFPGPAHGCGWSWEVLRGRRLEGARLPATGVMDLESAKAAAENDPDCVGFCFRAADEVFYGERRRWRILLRAAAGRLGTLRPPPPPELDEEQLDTLSPEELRDLQEESEDQALWASYLKVDLDPVHDVRALLAAGADAGVADGSGLSALHHHLRSAPGRGSAAVVEALLRGGADVNARDRTERAQTPLILAVSAKRADLVRLMLSEAFPPADVDAPAADGTSPLSLAESISAHQVAQILREAGASAWTGIECRLGARTTFSWDSRAPPVPA